MTRDEAKALLAVYQDLQRAVGESLIATYRTPGADPDRVVRAALSGMTADLFMTILPSIYNEHPALRPPEEVPEATAPLSDEESRVVAALSDEACARIDAALVEAANIQWRKVAMVIATALPICDEFPGLSWLYLAARVKALAEAGTFDSQGCLDYVRHSEVRLRQP